MRGVALPAAMLCAALGLLLAFAPRRAWAPSLALLTITAVGASFVPIAPGRIEIVYAGCWISVILLAALLHLPGVPIGVAMIAALDAGLWSGLLTMVAADRTTLVRALPAVAVLLPAAWAVRRGWGIAPKVVSSWLIAIALLAALLPTTTTPGYVPDHMD